MSKTVIKQALVKQQGLTLISWMVVGTFLLFQAVIALNIVPVYMTDSSVKSVMSRLPSDLKAQQSSPKQLKALVISRLNINDVRSIDREDITITKGRGENIISIEYEPRGKMIGNLEFIVNFQHEAVVPTR